jgi:hypothetical protein
MCLAAVKMVVKVPLLPVINGKYRWDMQGVFPSPTVSIPVENSTPTGSKYNDRDGVEGC